MSNKFSYIILLLIISLVLMSNLMSFSHGHSWGDDFSAYIDQARAVASGNFDELLFIHKYRFENTPPNSATPYLYPWGFPILLSPIIHIFGLNINAMKIYVYFFFLASLIITFLLFKDRLKNIDNLFLVAIMSFNPLFFKIKDHVLSDFPFLFFSLLSLFLIKLFAVSNKIWINKFFSYFLIGFLIFFSSEIRSIGFVLLPTLLFAQFVESKVSKNKNGLNMYNFIPYITFFIFYSIKSWIFPSSTITAFFFQGNSLQETFQLVIPHIKLFALRPSSFFLLDLEMRDLSQNFFNYHFYLYCLIMLFIILGIVFNAKKDYIFIAYGFFTLTVLVLFPNSHMQGPRYVFPILPFYLYFLFAGLSKITLPLFITDKIRCLNINSVHIVGLALIIISLFQTSHYYIAFNKRKVINGPYTADSMALFDYIKRNINKDDIIIFPKPRAMSLYTNRRSIKISKFDKLSNSPADYIVYIKKIPWWYQFQPEDLKNNYKCRFENETFILCDLKES